jgi:hypothetical protein
MEDAMTTLIIVGVAVVGLVAWDLYAAFREGVPTITSVVRRAPKWVGFLVGFVAGHLFWP